MIALVALLACESARSRAEAEALRAEDNDGDGFSEDAGDCNDERPDMSPGGHELCDGLDNNCDGSVDEGVPSTWYLDSDGDGWGDDDVAVPSCDAPTHYVPTPGDCDDDDPSSHPGATEDCDARDNDCNGTVDDNLRPEWWSDADGDGYGDPASPIASCWEPDGAVTNDFDCDDADPAVNPAAVDVCNDIDDDCDGEMDDEPDIAWAVDQDGDGWGGSDTEYSCDPVDGKTDDVGDSDDADPAVNPGVPELCDYLDNDGDGDVDEDPEDGSTFYVDADGDGIGGEAVRACTQPEGAVSTGGDADDADASTFPGATEICDGKDNDGDGSRDEADAADAPDWYADADGDGWGSGSPVAACTRPTGMVENDLDCDDADASTTTGAALYRDFDTDGYGDATSSKTACAGSLSGYVSDDSDCDDTRRSTHPGASETCDGEDDDCDGTADEDATDTQPWYWDSDGDGYGDEAITVTDCTPGSGWVDVAGDCDDGDAAYSPDAAEACDGVDNDCDGKTDEVDAVDRLTWYRDYDGDGYGNPKRAQSACDQPSGYVADADDCDDADGDVNPDGTETCNGVDDDCDGNTDFGNTVGVDHATIQDAIDAASDGDEICIPAGTWTERVDLGGKRITLGGEGPGKTILDGGGSGPVISATRGETASTMITALTVSGASASAGSAIYVDNSGLSVVDVEILDNTCSASTCKGSIAAVDGDLVLRDVLVEGNDQTSSGAGWGNGLFADSSTVTIENSRFIDHYSYSGHNYGCAMAFVDGSSVSMEGVEVADTLCSTSGSSYGTVYLSASTITAEDLWIHDNTDPRYGGALALDDSTGTLTHALLAENSVTGAGGGLWLSNASHLELTNCVVAGNHGGGGGGALYAQSSSYATFINCDLAGNTAYAGAGIFGSGAELINTNIVGNAASWAYAAVYLSSTYVFTSSYSNWYGNGANAFSGASDPSGSGGNIAVDPDYTDTTSSSDSSLWDLSLGSASGVVDMGDPSILDTDGSTSDIGAYGGPSGSW